MFAVSMPNFDTSAALVETATKCFATAFSSPPNASSDHARAVAALVIVSSVVKVFDETMKSVSAGSRSATASAKSVPSMLETNRSVSERIFVCLQRLVGHHRPQVGAADADVHDVANPLAGVAFPLAAPNTFGEVRHPVEHFVDTPAPHPCRRQQWTSLRGARSATWSTARSSVLLIFSPANIASIRSRKPHSSASRRRTAASRR